ncbi:LCP family protein [Streptomyces sp. NPDC059002]|uniref:LCP family protein n=1 Tax=Streptomyces sp. NPDC059002 TaxID=3346690 RepID=UPI0036C8EB57
MADKGSRAGGRRWPKRVALSLLVLVVLVAAYGTGLYFWAGSRLRTTDAFTEYESRPGQGKGTDWLLVGSDSRSSLTPEQRKELHVGNDQGLNTDTIMVLHYGDSGPSLVSIPRDSYVAIPGHGKGKINSAYALGGAPLLTRTVEQATGLRVDHYAEVNFLGFVDVVDALGGVTICVPDGGLHDEKSGADFDGGCQHMDGVQALQYVRARYSDPQGDLGRVRRQQQLVSAVAKKAVSVSVLLPPWNLIPFLSASLDALTVDKDTGVGTLAHMGFEMEGLSSGSGTTTTVPVASEPEIAGVGDVVVWDQVKADQLFEALRNDTPIPTSDAN